MSTDKIKSSLGFYFVATLWIPEDSRIDFLFECTQEFEDRILNREDVVLTVMNGILMPATKAIDNVKDDEPNEGLSLFSGFRDKNTGEIFLRKN